MLIQIVPYSSRYKSAFYLLNIEWLKHFFYVEPLDEEVLSKPEDYIINKGGHIFFAVANQEVVGTVALMPVKNCLSVFELTKMAVSPKLRGQKIGQKLLTHCINFAKEKGWSSLILYSNTTLENAIYIYRKLGFKEIAVEENSPYKRSNIKMVLTF